MTDKPTHQDRLKTILHQNKKPTPAPKKEVDAEEVEVSCGAFGYLRGIRDLPGALELRFRNGNSTWFPYAWMCAGSA